MSASGKAFRILTVGWELSYIEYFAVPVSAGTGFHFTYGLVGDASRVPALRRSHPNLDFVALSKSNSEPLPPPDYKLLATLEHVGIPTVKSMVQGDRVLRDRPEGESLGYATLIARRILEALREVQPDLVMGTFDSLHSSLSLAVAKSQGIPWVTLSFTSIPHNLTGFCMGMTPNTLVPMVRAVDDKLRGEAREIVRSIRSNRQQVLAYRPPSSFSQRARHALVHARNFARRLGHSRELGYDRFTWPTARERLRDIVRRSINALRLPRASMLGSPPKGRYAFFPLHMAPESSVDTWAPLYQDQLALAFQVCMSLPADIPLVIKLHFGDPDNYSRKVLLELMKLCGLRIARPEAPSHAFLRDAALVIGIQGTANLEAALLGKSVLMFGDSPYLHFPRTERANRPDELAEQIRHMLQQPAPMDEEIEAAYAAYMARYMPGRINDWNRPIEPNELERLCGCFRSLKAYLDVPENRVNWYTSPCFAAESERGSRFERDSRIEWPVKVAPLR